MEPNDGQWRNSTRGWDAFANIDVELKKIIFGISTKDSSRKEKSRNVVWDGLDTYIEEQEKSPYKSF